MYIGNACFHEWPMNSKKYEVWWIRWVIDVKVDDLQINFIWLLMSHQLRMFSIANRWILILCIMYPCVCFQKWHFFLQTWSKFQLLWHLPSQSASKVDLSTVWDKGKNGKQANLKIRNNSFWKHLLRFCQNENNVYFKILTKLAGDIVTLHWMNIIIKSHNTSKGIR